MGKRSEFERVARDFYPTPMEAVRPLFPHLLRNAKFYEPCGGDGRLVTHLETDGHVCMGAWDIEPQSPRVGRGNALDTYFTPAYADCIITNPPWDRKILHPMIEHFSNQLPTWLLFDADWMHTRQSAKFMDRLEMVVSVGRVKWIPDSKMTGKDNCAWYLFDKPSSTSKTIFIGR